MLWELPVMYGVLSVHLEINVQNKRLLYLLPILTLTLAHKKKPKECPPDGRHGINSLAHCNHVCSSREEGIPGQGKGRVWCLCSQHLS